MLNNGLTGWLTPEGEFIPCDYGKHHEFANLFMQNAKYYAEKAQASIDRSLLQHNDEFLRRVKSYIPMGVQPGGSSSYIHFHIDPAKLEAVVTDEQVEWFRANFNLLTDEQKKQVTDWVSGVDEFIVTD